MRSISPLLSRAQKGKSILAKNFITKIDLTYGATSYSYTKTRIKELSRTEAWWSQTANLLLEDSDKVLHGLNLEGYKAVISYGLITRSGPEYIATAPLWVVGQQRDSYRDRLECSLSLEGIFDRMAKHKADASYTPESGDTRTVKAWLKEIISLTNSASESTESQETYDDDWRLSSAYETQVGQKLTIANRRITKLAFKLKKGGDPTGEIIFIISSTTSGVLAYKVWGNASTLTTSYDWCEITLDTPLQVSDEVRLLCDFSGGNVANYVAVACNTAGSVKANECLTWLGATLPYTDEAVYDAVYRYSYSATPVTCYDDYPAYGLVFDSEDDLIDSFCPADSFRINLNDSRLQKVRELMGYTDCVARVQNDGFIHIFVPTTSGTTYDEQYSLAEGYHTFFNKRFRRRIVSPNYIIFTDYDETVSGSAKDDSADLTDMLEMETFKVRTTSIPQCTNLATAYLSKLQMDAEKGAAVVPFMNFAQEAYDYVNIVDARAGDSRQGNIGYITKYYQSGQASMSFGFGRAPVGVVGLQGYDTENAQTMTVEQLKAALFQLQNWLSQIANSTETNQENIKVLFGAFNNLLQDAYFKKLTVTERLRIPFGENKYG